MIKIGTLRVNLHLFALFALGIVLGLQSNLARLALLPPLSWFVLSGGGVLAWIFVSPSLSNRVKGVGFVVAIAIIRFGAQQVDDRGFLIDFCAAWALAALAAVLIQRPYQMDKDDGQDVP